MNDCLKFGTAGGTLLGIFVHLNYRDLLEAIVLSALGAIVSFAISYLMKYLFKKHPYD
jgi:hypothetical protein